MNFKKWLILAFAGIFAVLIFQNTGIVSFQVFFWKISMSGIILYSIIFIVGFLIGWLGSILFRAS